ncbi:uncharacterized protein LOC144127555 [Amblyomma americanum]
MPALTTTLFLALFCLHESECARAAQGMNWCGKKLNPIQLGRSARFAAELFSSCKEHLKFLGIDPTIVKESRRLCSVIRICYAYVDDLNETQPFYSVFPGCLKKVVLAMETTSTTLAKNYPVKISTLIDRVQQCQPKNMPEEEVYLLGMLAWFSDFVVS